MIRPFAKIRIRQATPYSYKDSSNSIQTVERSKLLELDFHNEFEIESTWANHTDDAKVVFPKNIVLQTKEFLFKETGTYNVLLGSSGETNYDSTGKIITVSPLIMRGDLVEIEFGYYWKNEQWNDVSDSYLAFSGYVVNIDASVPIKIELEDNFYLLKRTPVNKSFFRGNIQDLGSYMLTQANALFAENEVYNKRENGNPYPSLILDSEAESTMLGDNADNERFSLSNLFIDNVTCAELLSQLRTSYHIESFFIDNKLHIGMPIYNESRATQKYFFFFKDYYINGKLEASANIFEEDLEFKSKEDTVLSAIITATGIKETGKTTRKGQKATKKEKVSVLVYWDLATRTFKYHTKEKGKPFPKNDGGERHDIPYSYDITKAPPTVETLAKYGIEHLKKYQYTGFTGSFKTFGYPFVKWNDNIILIDPVVADKNGVYKVKKVIYRGGVKGGVKGLSQEVFLDYKLNIPIPKLGGKIFMI